MGTPLKALVPTDQSLPKASGELPPSEKQTSIWWSVLIIHFCDRVKPRLIAKSGTKKLWFFFFLKKKKKLRRRRKGKVF